MPIKKTSFFHPKFLTKANSKIFKNLQYTTAGNQTKPLINVQKGVHYCFRFNFF